MKEHPILFGRDMVRTILDGRKTQTRRIAKPQPDDVDRFGNPMFGERGLMTYGNPCPFGIPGDRLWVRESFRVVMASIGYDNGEGVASVLYQADQDVKTFCGLDAVEDAQASRMLGRGMPSIHMPRWASRITLEIVSVRVDRLAEISDDDARAEGFNGVDAFADCWDDIYKNWDQDPWVWVVEFKRLEAA